MNEELPKNEYVIIRKQITKVIAGGGTPVNRQRRYVSAPWLICWLLLATLSLSLWLLRLLDMTPLPF